MNEEEKKTIEKFIEKCYKYDESVEIKGISVGEEYRMLNTVCKALNLIEKLQKENEELRAKWDKDTHILQNKLDYANADRIDLAQQNKELRKENEELKEKENKIYKEVHESLAFEKFLIVKERKPDLFNQGRFYISQIIYDILNDVQNPEGIHKENKCIQYIDYIPVQKVKDNIKKLEIKKEKARGERDILERFAIEKSINSLQELLYGRNK